MNNRDESYGTWKIAVDPKADSLFKMPWWKELIFTIVHRRKPKEMPWHITREFVSLKEILGDVSGEKEL